MNRDMLQYMGIVDEFNKDIHIEAVNELREKVYE